MTRKRLLIILATTLVVIIAAAWGFETLVSGGTPGSGPEGYEVVVTRADAELARFDLDELRELGVQRLTIQGKPEEGPTLLSVLWAAGVDEFERLYIGGWGVRDDGTLVLERADVTEEILLDIANRGTVKVVGPDIAWVDRVRDITEIVVE